MVQQPSVRQLNLTEIRATLLTFCCRFLLCTVVKLRGLYLEMSHTITDYNVIISVMTIMTYDLR